MLKLHCMGDKDLRPTWMQYSFPEAVHSLPATKVSKHLPINVGLFVLIVANNFSYAGIWHNSFETLQSLEIA